MKSLRLDIALFPARRLFRRRGFDFDPAAFAFAFALGFSALDPLGFALELASDLGEDFAFDFPAAFAAVLAFVFAFAFKAPASLRCFFLGTTDSSTASIIFL